MISYVDPSCVNSLLSSGTASEVSGIDSDTLLRNIVSESRMVTSETKQGSVCRWVGGWRKGERANIRTDIGSISRPDKKVDLRFFCMRVG